MPTTMTRAQQQRILIAKAVTVLMSVLMGAGIFGLWAWGKSFQSRVSGVASLAATMRPGSFSVSDFLAQAARKATGGEASEEGKEARRDKNKRPELDEEFADLIKTHPLFGAPPQAGPPQANLQGILGDKALINGEWMAVGETKKGVKLLQTMVGKVLVEIEGNQREVSAFSDLPTKPFPPGPPSLMVSSRSDGGMSSRERAALSRAERRFGGPIGSLQDAFANRKDFMERASKMNTSDLYSAYQAYKKSGAKLPVPEEQIEEYFRMRREADRGGNRVYDGAELRGGGSRQRMMDQDFSESRGSSAKSSRRDREELGPRPGKSGKSFSSMSERAREIIQRRREEAEARRSQSERGFTSKPPRPDSGNPSPSLKEPRIKDSMPKEPKTKESKIKEPKVKESFSPGKSSLPAPGFVPDRSSELRSKYYNRLPGQSSSGPSLSPRSSAPGKLPAGPDSSRRSSELRSKPAGSSGSTSPGKSPSEIRSGGPSRPAPDRAASKSPEIPVKSKPVYRPPVESRTSSGSSKSGAPLRPDKLPAKPPTLVKPPASPSGNPGAAPSSALRKSPGQGSGSAYRSGSSALRKRDFSREGDGSPKSKGNRKVKNRYRN